MLDYISIFKKLNEKSVKYIVVGGIAVNLYGIPRMTYDIDLILDLEDENLKRFLLLLKGWGFKPRVPVDIMDFAKKNKREDWIKNKNMEAFNLVNPEWAMSEIDIIINTPVDYKKASKNINHINLKDVSVPTVSIDNLIKMKQKTGIIHIFSGDINTFARKQRRRIRDYLYYNKLGVRKYPWKNVGKVNLLKFIEIYSVMPYNYSFVNPKRERVYKKI